MSDNYAESLVQLLFKIKLTLIELLSDRGYDTDNDAWLQTTTIGDFITHYKQTAGSNSVKFKEALSETYYKKDTITTGGNNTLRVIFVETPKTSGKPANIGVNFIKDLNAYLDKHKDHDIIIVTETPLTHNAKTDIKKLISYNIEHFVYRHLVFNITKHFLVPKHRLMKSDEARTFLKENNINIDKLPIMSIEDPIARYYGASPGQIFEIERFDVTGIAISNTSISHRTVKDIPLEIPPQPTIK